MIDKVIEKIENYRRFLNDLYKNANHKDDNDKFLNSEQNKVIDDLEKEIKEVDSGWIPCNERLPKENKDDLHNFSFSDLVMVTVYDIERDLVMGVNCDMTIDGKWQGYQSCDGTEVIAWQPLPKPYKAESEE